jgi:hypothetical protein
MTTQIIVLIKVFSAHLIVSFMGASVIGHGIMAENIAH